MKDEDRGDLKDQSFEGPLVIVDSDDRVPEEKPNRSSSVAHPNELSIELPDESFQEFSQDIQVLDEVNELSGDEQPSCSTEVISTDELKSICVGIEPKESDDDEILVLEDCHFDEFEDGEFEVQDEEMEAEEFHSEEIDGQLTEMKRKRSEEMRTVLRVSSTHTLVESDEEEQIFVVKDELVDDVTQASSNNLEEKIVDKDATVIDNNSGSVIDMSVLSVENVVDDSGLEDFESALIQYGKMTETSLQLSCAVSIYVWSSYVLDRTNSALFGCLTTKELPELFETFSLTVFFFFNFYTNITR